MYSWWRRLFNAAFTRLVSREFALLGEGVNLQLPIDLYGTKNISLGDGTIFWPGCILRAEGEGRITVGCGVTVRDRASITAGLSVTIGDGARIGRGTHISDHDHRDVDPTGTAAQDPRPSHAPVEIGPRARVGHGAVVLPGVRIGEGAVIGANAVVLSDIPDFAVAVGAPARIVRIGPGPAARSWR
jgi:acetyltransferase-like isoleucine patch superfamily enzyme